MRKSVVYAAIAVCMVLLTNCEGRHNEAYPIGHFYVVKFENPADKDYVLCRYDKRICAATPNAPWERIRGEVPYSDLHDGFLLWDWRFTFPTYQKPLRLWNVGWDYLATQPSWSYFEGLEVPEVREGDAHVSVYCIRQSELYNLFGQSHDEIDQRMWEDYCRLSGIEIEPGTKPKRDSESWFDVNAYDEQWRVLAGESDEHEYQIYTTMYNDEFANVADYFNQLIDSGKIKKYKVY